MQRHSEFFSSGYSGNIIQESRAKVVYNGNLVSKRWHTDGFMLEDYVESIDCLLGGSRIDYATYNTRLPSEDLLTKYAHEAVLTGRRPAVV